MRWFENHGVNPAKTSTKKDKPFATNFALMSATWSLLSTLNEMPLRVPLGAKPFVTKKV